MISSRNSMTKDDEFILGNRQLANHALDDRLSLKSSLTQHYGEYSGQQVQSSYSKQIVDSRSTKTVNLQNNKSVYGVYEKENPYNENKSVFEYKQQLNRESHRSFRSYHETAYDKENCRPEVKLFMILVGKIIKSKIK